MKTLFPLILLLFNLNLLGQRIASYCPIDTNDSLGIVIDISIFKDSTIISTGIHAVESKTLEYYDDFCIPHPFE